METKKKIWLNAGGLWSFLLGLFLLCNQWMRPTFLPVPANLHDLSISYQKRVLHLEKKGQQWFLEGKKVRTGRVEEVLKKLQTCQNPYPSTEIIQPKSPRPVIIKFAGKKYVLDGYNAFHRSHYLDDGEKSWFCDEGLKAILAQPAASWFNPS